jgi:Rieske Fe-S protein
VQRLQLTELRSGKAGYRFEFENVPELAKPGGSIFVAAPGLDVPVVLINLDSASFRALSGVCTHLGCNVRPSGRFLQCPCHGSTYDLEGQVTRGPAEQPLRMFETHRSNGKVEVVVSGQRRDVDVQE